MLRSAAAYFFSLVFLVFAAQVACAASPDKASIAGQPTVKKKTVSRTVKRKKPQAKRTAQRRARQTRKVSGVKGKRKVVRVAKAPRKIVHTAADQAGLYKTPDPLDLKSNVAYIVDQASGEVLLDKNADVPLPIASITKLMTALVILDARQDMEEVLTITRDDVDRIKYSRSRLRVGARVKRADLLHIALMSSENRAASALGRHYPGGTEAFVAAMNAKAKALGMHDTCFADASGLSSDNIASAKDLAKLVTIASQRPLIRDYSTDLRTVIDTGRHMQQYANTNRLVRNATWKIGIQKTGYISEAGRCLVMQAKVKGREIVMIFLDSKGKLSRLGDASRVRNWLVDYDFTDLEEKAEASVRREEKTLRFHQPIPQEMFSLDIPES